MAWTYNGWRRESGLAAQRAMLILHLEEVESKLAGFFSFGHTGRQAERFDLQSYRDRLEKQLSDLDDEIAADSETPFVRARPA